MSFHRRMLPSVEKLEELRKNCKSDEEFIEKVRGKAETFQGSPESFKFIEEIEKSLKKDR